MTTAAGPRLYREFRTGDVTLEYTIGNGFSVFGGYSNVFNAFYLDGEGREDRIFYELRRGEEVIATGHLSREQPLS